MYESPLPLAVNAQRREVAMSVEIHSIEQSDEPH